MVAVHPDLAATIPPGFGPVLAYGRGAVEALRRIGCQRSRIHRVRALDHAIVALERHPYDAVVVDETRVRRDRAAALAVLDFHRAEVPLFLVDGAPPPPLSPAPVPPPAPEPPRAPEPPPPPLPATEHASPTQDADAADAGAFAEACLDHLGDLPALEQFVLATLADASGARRASLLTAHPQRPLLCGRAARGPGEASVATWRVPFGFGLAGRVAERGRPLVGRGERGGLRCYEGHVYALLPFAGTGAESGVVALTDFEPDAVPSEASLARLTDMARRAGRALAVARRVVEAERNATIDPLTGLPNRRAYKRAMERELSRAARLGDRLGLALIDLDHFKHINDRYGHDAGDVVLREFTRRLGPHFRTTDLLARWGGEEFVVILPSLPPTPGPEDLLAVDRARQLIERRPFRLPAGLGDVQVTFTAGVAAYPENGTTAEALLKAADRALYGGKDDGRNRVVLAD